MMILICQMNFGILLLSSVYKFQRRLQLNKIDDWHCFEKWRTDTNDDTDLPDELRDIVAKFTDNISSTNNGETEEIKREENADSDYFVGGHWRSVHRQEDSPTTVSLYIGSPMPYSANSKKEFTIDHRNKLDEVQERHIVPANEMGDVYDTFEVGPDKDAYFWIEEYEQNNPISKGFSYVGGVSKTVESK
eukprot:18994_1